MKKSSKPLDLKDFSGEWCIISTSLSFWKTRKNPRIHYTLEPIFSTFRELRLRDEVIYTRQGKTKTVLGYDTPLSEGGFLWRGEPCYMRQITSRWQVVLHDVDYTWAVTYFEKTLFTDAGVDIYVRARPVDSGLLDSIQGRMAEVELLKPFVERMFLTEWE